MSGVSTRTRLQELQALELRVKHEIDYARRRADGAELARLLPLRTKVEAAIRAGGGELRTWMPPLTTPPAPVETQVQYLARLGITARDVKVWAVSAGLLERVKRGRVSTELIEAYAWAHPSRPTYTPSGAPASA